MSPTRRIDPRRIATTLLLLLPLLGGCSSLGYYASLAQGQRALLKAREPIERIVGDEQRDPELRRRLQKVQEARRWAVGHLKLPDNQSYTTYADLGRPYVVWNVFAAPELSLEPLQNCFPLIGCMAYRGYYRQQQAEQRADQLRHQGYDVHVGGVPAYSTLNWFADPVLSTMMRWSDEVLVGMIFHELAHQVVYVRDDTAFNESYAEFVEEQGLQEYLAEKGGTREAWQLFDRRRHEFVDLVLATRSRLVQVFSADLSDSDKRAAKKRQFEQLAQDYQQLRDGPWAGYAGFDGWFAKGEPNNARLLPFALYDEHKPAFAVIFQQAGGDWAKFHGAVRELSKLPSGQRLERLRTLARQQTGMDTP
ncbi:aminopeptidase [Solimonas sp. K1W22B-7]|uniref:aminopeptidase n=1 Tax=Solimonas sp. K1W22B-7 TaxID=2303331 RepID=UPI000E330C21|nr:aminopeptidase [Solimonas sp. K1W22B-7]AXQ29828.1 aminopeptidase [Solimonas sp. K1W22B-7]